MDEVVRPWHRLVFPIPGGIEKMYKCGIWGCGFVVVLAVLGQWLDLTILESFSNLKDSIILCPAPSSWPHSTITEPNWWFDSPPCSLPHHHHPAWCSWLNLAVFFISLAEGGGTIPGCPGLTWVSSVGRT